MERYDGKSKKNDHRKYALIAAAVVVVIVVWCLVLDGGSGETEADFRVLYASSTGIDSESEEYLEDYIGGVVGDQNHDGETVVEIVSTAIDPEEYADASSAFLYLAEQMSEEDISLVLLTDEPVQTLTISFDGLSTNFCNQEGYFMDLPELIADTDYPNRAALNDSAVFIQLGFEDGPLLYGSVLEGQDDDATELALTVLEELKYSMVVEVTEK